MYSLYSGLYSKISMYKALCTDTHCVTALHSYTVLYSYTALHIIQLYSAIVHYTTSTAPLWWNTDRTRAGSAVSGARPPWAGGYRLSRPRSG